MAQFNRWLRENGVEKDARCYRIACKGEASEGGGEEERLRVTISSGARDRHGDVLEPGGARIASFLKNPVVLWAHDYRALPIGRVASLTRDGEALRAEIVFAPTEFAQEARKLYAKGFLRGWSVGFVPLEWDVIEDGEGRFAGYHVRSWELIELSAVPVPANPEALSEAIRSGLVRAPGLVESLEKSLSAVAGPETRSEAEGAAARRAEPDEAGPDALSRELAVALASRLMLRLRPMLGEAVGREIRRRQGRID